MARPKFSIRDLLWAMIVLGLALGWLLDHRQSRDELLDVHLQALMNFPSPAPKPGLRIQLLEEEIALLKRQLQDLQTSSSADGDEP